MQVARGFVRQEVDVAQHKAQRTGYRWIASACAGIIALASFVFLLLSLAFALQTVVGQAGGFAISGAVGLILAGIAIFLVKRSEGRP